MSTQGTRDRWELRQGTEEESLAEHGAHYPALQRLEQRGSISVKWGVSSNNRTAVVRIVGPEGAES
jgi:DNA-binding PadR family transcriptional regulator